MLVLVPVVASQTTQGQPRECFKHTLGRAQKCDAIRSLTHLSVPTRTTSRSSSSANGKTWRWFAIACIVCSDERSCKGYVYNTNRVSMSEWREQLLVWRQQKQEFSSWKECQQDYPQSADLDRMTVHPLKLEQQMLESRSKSTEQK